MDKVKLALAVVKKHHFWALSGVVILLALISWAKATSDLAGRFQERKSKLANQFREMDNIRQQADHPNAAVIQSLATKKENLEKKVLDAWEILYKQQKANNRLPEVLGDDFKKAFESLTPGQELQEELRNQYLYFIGEHLPKLFDVVQYLRPAEEKQMAARPGKPGPPSRRTTSEDNGRRSGTRQGREGSESAETQMVGAVVWDEPDRKRIEDHFRWERTPSTVKVLLAQEDLWVYEALLRVIKNTNGDAKNNYDAAVKRIDQLLIGAEVHGAAPGTAGRTVAAPTAAEGSPGGVDEALLEKRYVDTNFNLLAANAPPPYAEFNMVPVRMQLVVQQQKIPKLLVECANSTMPIEVRAVRLWYATGPPLDIAAPAGTPGADAGRDMGIRTIARTLGRTETSTTGQPEGDGKDVPVEIEGIVYIFNPPDKAKLGTGTGAAGQVAPSGEESPEQPPDENMEPSAEPSPEPPAEPTTAAPLAPPYTVGQAFAPDFADSASGWKA